MKQVIITYSLENSGIGIKDIECLSKISNLLFLKPKREMQFELPRELNNKLYE